MVNQFNNEFFRKKFADLKQLVVKENRLTQNDLNKIFKPINETSIKNSKSIEKENPNELDTHFIGIENIHVMRNSLQRMIDG